MYKRIHVCSIPKSLEPLGLNVFGSCPVIFHMTSK